MNSLPSGVRNILTIDDVDPTLIKELVGYWKGNERSGLSIKDYSGNSFDLGIECNASLLTEGGRVGGLCGEHLGETFQGNLDKCWNSFPDYFTPYSGIGAMIDAVGTLLDTGNKYVVYGCEQVSDFTKGNGDFDCGGYWAGEYGTPPPQAFPQQLGYNWALSFMQHWFRIAWDNGSGVSYSSIITDVSVGQGQFPPNVPIGVAAAFLPNTSFKASMGDNAKVSTVTTSQFLGVNSDTSGVIPASLELQDGRFGFRGQDRRLVGSWRPTSGMRNFYVWAFDNEPPYLDEGLQWLAKYPSSIPPFWIGLT